jgi:hypothetical protein
MVTAPSASSTEPEKDTFTCSSVAVSQPSQPRSWMPRPPTAGPLPVRCVKTFTPRMLTGLKLISFDGLKVGRGLIRAARR